MKKIWENISGMLWPAVFLVVTFFIFGSVDMYFANQTEFWFSVWDVFLPCILCALIVVAVLLLLTAGVSNFSKKTVDVLIALVFGLSLALYLQGNYMVIDYGVLDGKTIQWNEYNAYGILTGLVWILCIAAPLTLLFIKPQWFKVATKFGSLFIIAMQIVTLFVLFLTNNIYQEKQSVYTTENQFHLSTEKNVIVFILDSFDTQYMDDLLQEYPEVKDNFKDFTYFNNTLGVGPTTRESLPFILTSSVYLNEEPYNDYLSKAYTSSPIISALKAGGYEADFYTHNNFAVTPTGESPITNIEIVETDIDDKISFLETYLKLISFRYAPHYTKSAFWIATSEFEQYQTIHSEFELYSQENINLYNALMTENLCADRNVPVMKVYHIMGTHPPLDMDENLKTVDISETTGARQGRGCLKIIEEYLNQLKTLNLYDKTSIVIMADHGMEDYCQRPLLMVKQANTSYDSMQINSAPVSYVSDWANTIVSLLGGETSGETVFDIHESDTRTRNFYYYTWDDLWDAEYMPELYEFQINGKANTMTEAAFTGKIYRASSNGDYQYTLGQVCEITDDNFYLNAVKRGVTREATTSGRYGWFHQDAQIMLELEKIPKKNLLLTFDIGAVNGNKQSIEVFVNGISLGESEILLGESKKQYIIPAELVNEKLLTIDIHSLDASTYGNLTLPVSFSIASMQLEETKEDALQPIEHPLVNSAATVYFNNENDAPNPVDVYGVYPAEETAAWSSETVRVVFETDRRDDMTFSISYGTFYKDLNGIVTFNGQQIGALTQSQATATFILPQEYINENGSQVVEISLPNATSPYLYGYSDSKVVLGLYISEISLDFIVLPEINTDTIINFHDNPNLSKQIMVAGMANVEWTSEETKFSFMTSATDDIQLNLTYGTFYEDLNAIVEFNGTEVGRLTESHASVKLTLPAELLNPKGKQSIVIRVPNATSPKQYGYSDSEEILGICLTSISFTF